MVISDSRTARRARLFFLIDSLGAVAHVPIRLLLWLLKGVYLGICMLSWGIILWVLGERHVGILKLLLLLGSVSIWVLILSSVYSVWF